MTQPNEPSPPSKRPHESAAYPPEVEAPPLDVLIGRIIDGEATLEQRQRFESMAVEDPALWRMLALRQQDMSMLAAHVEPQLNAAEKIDLPAGVVDLIESSAGEAGSRRLRVPWWIAISGWAAMIALAAVWSFNTIGLGSAQDKHGVPAGNPPTLASLTPEQHLREYLQAPYVLNEMPPTLLDTDELPDGRIAVSFLRRIVEVRYVDSPEDIPRDAEGNLTGPPTKLARERPPVYPQD